MHESDEVVAFGGAGTKTAADLLSDAKRISLTLPPAYENSHALLVFEQDRYAMAAALIGALDRGHAVALPPNSRRDSILAVHGRPAEVTTDLAAPLLRVIDELVPTRFMTPSNIRITVWSATMGVSKRD